METLPPVLWGVVFGFIPAHRYAARCVCKAWRALQESPAIISPRTVLETLEAGGDPAWLKAAVAGWGPEKANKLLARAAAEGNIKGMRLAKDWGALNFGSALISAAHNGQLEAIRTLRCKPGWGTGYSGVADAFISAAKAGQLEAIELLKLCGATKLKNALDGAFAGAAGAGQLEAMEMLYQFDNRGGLWWERMISVGWGFGLAAEAGQLGAMELMETWNVLYVSDYNNVLCDAAGRGQLKMMEMMKGRGATFFNWALRDAAEKGRLEAMGLLKEWGATNFDEALVKASAAGHLYAAFLLRHWGQLKTLKLLKSRDVTNFNSAAKENLLEELEFLESWGAADTGSD